MSPTFQHHTIDSTGRRHRGRTEAATSGALVHALERSGLVVLEVEQAREATAAIGPFLGRASAVLEFTRACAALLRAGMPLSRALSTASLVTHEKLQPVIESIRERVDRGTSLADALSQNPMFFSPVYTGVVRAGEKGGDLAGSFERLSLRLEAEQELRSKLISLSIYPALLALAGGAAVLVLIRFVLPRFADLLTSTGSAMPWSTGALLGLSQFTQSYGWLLLALALAGAALLVGARRTHGGQLTISGAILRIPIVGSLRRERLSGSFAGMVGMLMTGGAPLLRSLDDTAECLTDPITREEVRRIRGRVREGASLRESVAEGSFFPPLLERLIGVGEESARLPEFLLEAAALFERRTQRGLERMVALVEPAMILVFGGIVAFIALALLQGIYGINAGSLR